MYLWRLWWPWRCSFFDLFRYHVKWKSQISIGKTVWKTNLTMLRYYIHIYKVCVFLCVNGVRTYLGTNFSSNVNDVSLNGLQLLSMFWICFRLKFATETHHELIYEKLFIFKCKVLVDLISNFNTLLALILTQFFLFSFCFLRFFLVSMQTK